MSIAGYGVKETRCLFAKVPSQALRSPEKLQSESIRQLEAIFAPVLDKLGYSAPSYAELGIPVPRL